MNKLIVFVFLYILSTSANATWLNSSGKIVNIITYANKEAILVTISTNGIDVAECSNKSVFAISASISSEARARMYSMLLSAQATGRNITVAYNDVGGCEPWDSNSSVYRRINRLR